MDQQNTQSVQPAAPPPVPVAPPPMPNPSFPPVPVSPPASTPPPPPPSSVTIPDKKPNNLSKHIKIFSFVLLYIFLAGLSYFFYSQRNRSQTNKSAFLSSPTITPIQTAAIPTKTPEINVADTLATPAAGFGQLLPTKQSSSGRPPSSSPTSPPAVSPVPPSPKPTKKMPSVDRQNLFITADKNTFTPNQFTAEVYQIIDIIVTATDKDYDIAVPEINVYKVITKGSKDFVEFQVLSEGTYRIICRDLCAGAPQASATLTVK